MTGRYRIEPIHSEHGRSDFACGRAELDRYLRKRATQDVRRRASSCFVACLDDSLDVAGFFCLAATEVVPSEFLAEMDKRLPRYRAIPAVRLGRLGVDVRHGGRGLGATLLANAATKAARSDIGAFALIVDAKDEAAGDFYAHHGFVRLKSPLQLFLPLASVP